MINFVKKSDLPLRNLQFQFRRRSAVRRLATPPDPRLSQKPSPSPAFSTTWAVVEHRAVYWLSIPDGPTTTAAPQVQSSNNSPLFAHRSAMTRLPTRLCVRVCG